MPLLSGTATGISVYSGYVASNVLDGNDATYWAGASNPVADDWIYIDLGSIQTVSGYKILQFPYAGDWGASRFKVQKSDDAISWVDVDDVTPTADTVTRTLSQHHSCRYVRFYVVTGGGNSWNVYTIEIYAPDTTTSSHAYISGAIPPNHVSAYLYGDSITTILPGTAVPSSTWWTYAASNVLDDNDTTFWGSSDSLVGSWIYIDLGSSQTVAGYKILQGVPYNGAHGATRFYVQVSNDASSWRTVSDVSPTSDTVIRTLSTYYNCRYVRFYAASGGSNDWMIYTIDIYGYVPVDGSQKAYTFGNIGTTSSKSSYLKGHVIGTGIDNTHAFTQGPFVYNTNAKAPAYLVSNNVTTSSKSSYLTSMDAGVSLDASVRNPATLTATSTATLLNTNYTCGEGTKLLIVTATCAGIVARTGGVPTYDGRAFTPDYEGVPGNATECSVQSWFMIDPPIGEQYVLSVPNTGGLAMGVVISSFKVSNQLATIYNVTSGNTSVVTGINPSKILWGSSDYIELLYIAVISDGDSFSPTATTGTSLYQGDVGTWGYGTQYKIVNPSDPASNPMTWTYATSTMYCTFSLTFRVCVNNVSPALPTYISPVDNATGVSTNPQLSFYATDADFDNIYYNVQIDTSPTFNSIGGTLVDGISDAGAQNNTTLGYNYAGQSFTAPYNGKISSARFFLWNYYSDTGFLRIELCAHTGVYGVSSQAGTVLATGSSLLDAAHIGSSWPHWYGVSFIGDQQYNLVAGEHYVIRLVNVSTPGNVLIFYSDIENHSGNYIHGSSSYSTYDLYFDVSTRAIPLISQSSDVETSAFASNDVNPYKSGDLVTYTLPNELELEPNTTYYWRVNVKDTAHPIYWSDELYYYPAATYMTFTTQIVVYGDVSIVGASSLTIQGSTVEDNLVGTVTHAIWDGEVVLQTTSESLVIAEILVVGAIHEGVVTLNSTSTLTAVAHDIKASTYISSYLHGSEVVSESAHGFLLGNNTLTSVIHALVQAPEPVDVTASIYAYLRGSNSTTNGASSYLNGGEITNSPIHGFIFGNGKPADIIHAYINSASILTGTLTPIYLTGNTLISSSQQVFIVSSTETIISSTCAYMSGIIKSSIPCYLFGQVTNVDYIWLKTSDNGLTKSKKFKVLTESYEEATKTNNENVIKTISGGIDHSIGAFSTSWRMIVRVKADESDSTYGDLSDLEYFYSLNNPTANPSNDIIFLDHHQYEYIVHIVGSFKKNLLSTVVEGQQALYFCSLEVYKLSSV